jgi:hypothetical protein
MSIIVQCDCGKKYKVIDDKAGKKMRCKECNGFVVIPKPKPEPTDDCDDDYGTGEAAPRPKSKTSSKSTGNRRRKKSAKSGSEMSPIVKYGIAGGIIAVTVGIAGIVLMSGGETKEEQVARSDDSGKTEKKTVGGESKKPAKPVQSKQDSPVAAIEKLGGKFYFHKKNPGKPLSLRLRGPMVTDTGTVHLKGLTSLQELILGDTKVTDAGLVHFKGLTNLRNLYLSGTNVTDAGLVHLKGLTKLNWLDLNGSNVTDAGLVHLKGLTKLHRLHLAQTKVTDAGLVHLMGLTKLQKLSLLQTKVSYAGVRKLQAALPKCKISR